MAAMICRTIRAASPLPHGLNVAGYFHAELGVGEAARLLTRAIAATGSPTRPLESRPLSRQHHRFETSGAAAGAPFDINLLCVNADRRRPSRASLGPPSSPTATPSATGSGKSILFPP